MAKYFKCVLYTVHVQCTIYTTMLLFRFINFSVVLFFISCCCCSSTWRSMMMEMWMVLLIIFGYTINNNNQNISTIPPISLCTHLMCGKLMQQLYLLYDVDADNPSDSASKLYNPSGTDVSYSTRHVEESWHHLMKSEDTAKFKQIAVCNFDFLLAAVSVKHLFFIFSDSSHFIGVSLSQ